MTRFADALSQVVGFTPDAFRAFGAHIRDEWITEALAAREAELAATGEKYAKVRNRKLPLERLIWLVVGMGLFRDRSIHEVVEHLSLAVPRPGPQPGVAASSVSEGRARLGETAMWSLFNTTARQWAPITEADKWRGLATNAADGTVLDVPDTSENDETFGRPGGKKPGGYPQARVLALMSLRTHVLRAAVVGGCKRSELELARDLWAHVEDHSMTVLDRGFVCWGALWMLRTGGTERHWTVRQKTKLAVRVVEVLGPGDEIVEVKPAADARRKYPGLPKSLLMRRIACQLKGYRPFALLTSALDPVAYPAADFSQLYRERWKIELGYDELKTHLLERNETLRSQTPAGVRQEIAGICIAYNLVRIEMATVAAAVNVSPLRLSFRHAVNLVRRFCLWAWATSPGALPRRLASLDYDMRLLILPTRRTERRYPREVKVMTTSYTRKRPKADKSAPAA